MEQLVTCNKCNTNNSADAVKCSNCGFPFSRIKSERMEKFMENIQHKTTIVESSDLQMLKSETEPDAIFESKNPNRGFIHPDINVDAGYPEPENKSEMIDNSRFTESNPEEANSNPIKENSHQVAGDPAISEDSLTNEVEDKTIVKASEESVSCKKCGYILSDFSPLCPNCGHNNIPVSVTIRMPEKTQIMEKESQVEENVEVSGQNITGSYPDMRNKTEMYDVKRSLPGESNKTVAQQDQSLVSPLKTGSNDTIREEISLLSMYDGMNDQSSLREEGINEPKSKTRLEAIYLGQDSDQKMLINIPDNETSIRLNRTLIDPGDSTISSEDHAVIYKEENSWKIRNNASNKAVFIQVNDVSTLKDGDIIMLGGDKFYLFKDDRQA